MKKIWESALKNLFAIIFLISLLQSSKINAQAIDYGISIAVNSIQGQIGVPLMTGSGTVIVDADGNIVVMGGNRIDNSFSFSIVPKYYIKKDILLRFEFGITNLSLQANTNNTPLPSSSSIGNTEITIANAEVTDKIFRFTPGVQWFFMQEKKIESYFGLTASYIDYQSLYYNHYNEERDFMPDTLYSWDNDKEITPGGFAIGIGAFAGFNIYLRKKISIGAEISSSALYYKLGGETKIEDTEFNISGPNPSTTYNITSANSYKGFRISKIISSFNISIWL